MTNSEKLIWAAVYAAAWVANAGEYIAYQEQRAQYSALEANQALKALKYYAGREVTLWSCDRAKEMLDERSK